jgi:hypothetical protein
MNIFASLVWAICCLIKMNGARAHWKISGADLVSAGAPLPSKNVSAYGLETTNFGSHFIWKRIAGYGARSNLEADGSPGRDFGFDRAGALVLDEATGSLAIDRGLTS